MKTTRLTDSPAGTANLHPRQGQEASCLPFPGVRFSSELSLLVLSVQKDDWRQWIHRICWLSCPAPKPSRFHL